MLFQNKTVESIVAPLKKIVADLRALQEQKSHESGDLLRKSLEIGYRADEAVSESRRAGRQADRIEALLEGEGSTPSAFAAGIVGGNDGAGDIAVGGSVGKSLG